MTFDRKRAQLEAALCGRFAAGWFGGVEAGGGGIRTAERAAQVARSRKPKAIPAAERPVKCGVARGEFQVKRLETPH